MITRIGTCHYRVRTRSTVRDFMNVGTRSGTCDEHTMSVRTQACTNVIALMTTSSHRVHKTLVPVVKISKLSQFHAILMGRMMCIVCATRVAEGTTKRIGRFPTHHCFPVYRYLLLGAFSFVGSWKQFHIASPKNPMLYLKAQNHQFICGCNGSYLPRLP